MSLKAQYPFHCIQYAGGFIVATAGPKLYSFSASDGSKISTWPENKTDKSGEVEANTSAEHSDGPPEKKRKLSPTIAENDGDKEEKLSEASNKPATSWSSIPILVTSPTGRHVVAVTAEDKHLRVFDLDSKGLLTESSARPVPKKLCAVEFSSDGNTILCADKGGDVYSMPLLPGENGEFELVSRTKKPYIPAANSFVVHTKKNLESLRQQLRHKEMSQNNQVNSSNPTAKRDMLLGEVSMLTDLAFVSVPSSTSASGSHSYVLTADRDEQIRVSRGPPQTHVIEAYCLGHEYFVSKLCVPSKLPHLLISGGGDNFIFVWDWKNGRILHKVPIASDLESHQTVVRSIWAIDFAESSSVAILVALDGSRELLSFLLEENGDITPQDSIQASGNIIDLTYNSENNSILLAIDCCHEPGSTRNWKTNFDGPQTLLESYGVQINDGKVVLEPSESQTVRSINTQGTEEILTSVNESAWSKAQKSFSEILYNLQNLRKKVQGGRY